MKAAPRIDPRQLLHVVAVARCGSFSAAAQDIGLSQPALSKSIANLEYRLGVKIFERGRSGSSLNKAGQVLLRNAEGLIDVIERAVEEVQLDARGVAGPISIGSTPGMVPAFLPELLSRLHEQDGPMQIRIVEGSSGDLLEALQRRSLDLVLCPVGGKTVIPEDVVAEPLLDDPFGLIVGPDNPLQFESPVDLNTLVGEPWVLQPRENSFAGTIFDACNAKWPEDCVITTSLSLTLSLVAKSGRLAIVSRLMARFLGPEYRLYPLGALQSRTVGVCRARTMRPSPLCERVQELLRQVAADYGQELWPVGKAARK